MVVPRTADAADEVLLVLRLMQALLQMQVLPAGYGSATKLGATQKLDMQVQL